LREIAEFVAAVADYVRAESRALKLALGRVAWAVLLLVVAAVILLAALGFLLYALFLALVRVAALVVALVALLLSGGVAWYARMSLK